MNFRITIVALFLIPSALCAQQYGDMPLSLILIPTEGWKKVEGKFEGLSEIAVALPDENSMVVGVWGSRDRLIAVIGETGIVRRADLQTLKEHRVAGTVRLRNGITYHISEDKHSLKATAGNASLDIGKLPLTELSVLAVTPNSTTLLIADPSSKFIWWYRIDKGGTLSAGEKFSTLQLNKGESRSEVSSIDFDTWHRVYVAMKDGVQVFDPTGRLSGMLLNPSKERPKSLCFGGEMGDTLYLACGDEIWSRKLNATWHGFNAGGKK